jgi:hypothetical protein
VQYVPLFAPTINKDGTAMAASAKNTAGKDLATTWAARQIKSDRRVRIMEQARLEQGAGGPHGRHILQVRRVLVQQQQ